MRTLQCDTFECAIEATRPGDRRGAPGRASNSVLRIIPTARRRGAFAARRYHSATHATASNRPEVGLQSLRRHHSDTPRRANNEYAVALRAVDRNDDADECSSVTPTAQPDYTAAWHNLAIRSTRLETPSTRRSPRPGASTILSPRTIRRTVAAGKLHTSPGTPALGKRPRAREQSSHPDDAPPRSTTSSATRCSIWASSTLRSSAFQRATSSRPTRRRCTTNVGTMPSLRDATMTHSRRRRASRDEPTNPRCRARAGKAAQPRAHRRRLACVRRSLAYAPRHASGPDAGMGRRRLAGNTLLAYREQASATKIMFRLVLTPTG